MVMFNEPVPGRLLPSAFPGMKIRALWMFVAIDERGNEALLSFQSGGQQLPLLTTNGDNVAILKEVAKSIADRNPAHRIELRLFQGEMRVLDVIPVAGDSPKLVVSK